MDEWPVDVGREVYAELDSTNAEALRRAANSPGPLWILARSQSAARGRRNRPWQTGEGNFAASLLMTPNGGPAEAALRSFVAVLALHDALGDLVGGAGRFALKWPNDLLLDGRKLAGILLETAGPPLRLAVGFGVNLRAAPELSSLPAGASEPVSLRSATGADVAPETLLDRLGPAFAHWECVLVHEGFGPVRAAWLARAAHLGQPVVARLPGAEHRGRFATVDDSGAIVIKTEAGPRSFSAAELHFGTAQEALDAARH